jgi:diguanylate cyclase (GGDEF)-like protein/PAS domain S-box-containing protein
MDFERSDIDKARSDRELVEEQLSATLEVLRVSEERYRTAFETSLDAIAICRMDSGMFVDVNPAFFDVLGYSRDEIVGQASVVLYTWSAPDGSDQSEELLDIAGRSSQELNIWEDPDDWKRLTETLREGHPCRNFEARLRRKNGEVIWGQISASGIVLEEVPCILFVTRDITTVKTADDRIRSLSNYDPLTSLPNRKLLLDRMEKFMRERSTPPQFSALLTIDLDDFRLINESFGLCFADFILQETGRRISDCTGECDTVARLSGDEFAAMLLNLSEYPDKAATRAQEIAEKMLLSLAQMSSPAGHDGLCTASIGISIFDQGSRAAEEVVQQSNLAVGVAKDAGGNTMRFFAPELQEFVNLRAAMKEDLHMAIGTDQFRIHYQPQFRGDHLIGAEALIRWQHPSRGLLFPNAFIPLAEQTDLILPLGNWVLEAVCRQVALWAQSWQMNDFRVAVNISARQFHQSDFVERVLDILNRTEADPRNIEIELTEGSLVQDIARVTSYMSVLKSHGVRFSIDDFGTGYSSLSYLRRLPLDRLKIDISFVREIAIDTNSAAITRAIIDMSRAIDLDVIAEGVETEEQKLHLTRLGCRSFQGYLTGRPMAAEQFEKMMANLATASL